MEAIGGSSPGGPVKGAPRRRKKFSFLVPFLQFEKELNIENGMK